MENAYQLESANGVDVQIPEQVLEIQDHTTSGDAMLGWMTDEEFDAVADSIVCHFESLAGDLQPKEEKDMDDSIGEVVGWFLKEGVKLMPDSALKYLQNLIEQQLKENDLTESIYNEWPEWMPAKRVVKSEVY